MLMERFLGEAHMLGSPGNKDDIMSRPQRAHDIVGEADLQLNSGYFMTSLL